jgi:hypothetical protein
MRGVFFLFVAYLVVILAAIACFTAIGLLHQ